MNPARRKSFFAVLLCICLIFSLSVTAFAEDAAVAPSFTQLKDPAGEMLAVSKYGDTKNFPENSLEGILSAAKNGADMVYVHARKTADGYIVLMADENLSRMCVDSLGNVVDKNITDVGYHELSTYHLRAGTGSLHETITACTVPTLQEVVAKISGQTLLLLDGAWDFRDEVYDMLVSNNALNSVVFLASGDKNEVDDWLSSKSTMPLVISSYHGNVVFSARSTVSKTLSAGAVGTLLSTGNAYSVLYQNSVMSKFENAGRAVIDMTSPDLCGNREDNYLGWNDVTSRGYSVIITNNIQELCEYFDRVALQKERLSKNIEAAQAIDVTLCSTDSANALKDAITEAKAALEGPCSENSLMQSNYALQLAMNDLTNRTEDGGSGKTVTTGRIVAAVLVIIAFVIFEVVFDLLRRKKVRKRRKALADKRRRMEQQNFENTDQNN